MTYCKYYIFQLPNDAELKFMAFDELGTTVIEVVCTVSTNF